MGIIPAAALDVAATFAADVLAAPDPAALAAALVALAITGLISRGGGRRGRRPQGRSASRSGRRADGPRRAAVDVALLPRLPQRAPNTRRLRPASAPVVAASRPLRGPPGGDSQLWRLESGAGVLLR